MDGERFIRFSEGNAVFKFIRFCVDLVSGDIPCNFVR